MPDPALYIPLSPRLPPVTLDDLAQMLSIDLAFGRDKDFRRRLRQALVNFAAAQSLSPPDRPSFQAAGKDLPLGAKGGM